MATYLPGYKFTICTGWCTGLILPSLRKKWLRPYVVYAFVLNLCIVFSVATHMVNILKYGFSSAGSGHNGRFEQSILQGFALFYPVLWTIARVYMVTQSKKISSFLNCVDKCYSSDEFETKQSIRSIWNEFKMSSILMSIFILITLEAFDLASISNRQKKKNYSFFILPDSQAAIIFVVLWPAFLTRFVCFGVVKTTLEKLLHILNCFRLRLENDLKPSDLATQLVSDCCKTDKFHHAWTRELSAVEREHFKSLLDNFDTIQRFFECYDQLLGPLSLMLMTHCTVGMVDTTTKLLTPENIVGLTLSRAGHVVGVVDNLLLLTLVNTGYQVRVQVDEIKASMEQTIRGWLVHKENSTLKMMLMRIYQWNWKMSAAGFFIIDRHIMGGILSTLMTYTVIILQVQSRKEIVPTA